MRALVTGGLGFIGSHVADFLVAGGASVTVIDDERSSAVRSVHGAVVLRQSIAHAEPDRADVIFHLAGPVGPVGVLAQAGKIVSSVVHDAETVAWWAREFDCPLVYVSTSEVYGEQKQPVDETAPRIIAAGASARMEYAVAKMAAETMLLNRVGLDVRIIRPFNVAGPRQQEIGGFVLPRFVRQASRGEPLTVYQPGTQERAFTHVYDIAAGIIAAWREGEPRTVYNLGNAANRTTIAELARRVVAVVGSSSEVTVVDPRTLWGDGFREAPDKIPEAQRAQRELGWRPTIGLDAIIEDFHAEWSTRP